MQNKKCKILIICLMILFIILIILFTIKSLRSADKGNKVKRVQKQQNTIVMDDNAEDIKDIDKTKVQADINALTDKIAMRVVASGYIYFPTPDAEGVLSFKNVKDNHLVLVMTLYEDITIPLDITALEVQSKAEIKSLDSRTLKTKLDGYARYKLNLTVDAIIQCQLATEDDKTVVHVYRKLYKSGGIAVGKALTKIKLDKPLDYGLHKGIMQVDGYDLETSRVVTQQSFACQYQVGK